MNSSAEIAAQIYNTLIHGRGTAKEAVIRMLEDESQEIDRAQLHTLIYHALNNEYLPLKKAEEEDMIIQDVRCWLLSALGRLCTVNKDGYALIKKHLDPDFEPSQWARYWAYDGLIAGKASDLTELAKYTLNKDSSFLIQCIATAILASNGDETSMQTLKQLIVEPQSYWEVLRALRLVPIKNSDLVSRMCAIVDSDGGGTYDSIIVLGQIPSGSSLAENAARTLANYFTKHHWPMYDAGRKKALIGLGNLGVEWTASILLEGLTDDSPSIVCEAACALEKVVGIKAAVQRILEIASASTGDQFVKYANALRWMDRSKVVEQLEILMESGIDSQQKTARDLLQELGGSLAYQKLNARTNAVNKYLDTIDKEGEKIRQLFERSINEARGGFRVALSMDILVFLLGVGLIGVSAWCIIAGGGKLDAWSGASVTGGSGVLGILYSILVAKPRRQVREGVDHLMNLKVVFLGYLRQLYQVDQAFTRQIMDNKLITTEELSSFSNMVGKTMADAIDQLNKFSSTIKEDKTEKASDAGNVNNPTPAPTQNPANNTAAGPAQAVTTTPSATSAASPAQSTGASPEQSPVQTQVPDQAVNPVVGQTNTNIPA